MSQRTRTLAVALLATLASTLTIAAPRSAEMPELSGPGTLAIGTRYHEWSAGGRSIGVRLWFPAERDASPVKAVYRHRRALPGQQALEIEESGIASDPARPVQGAKFPLILMSHGYGGWAEHMSRLGETLSSRGYVVASIDHRDLPFTDAASFALSFGSVMLHRARDQQQVLKALSDGTFPDPAVVAQLDPDTIALLGFSMGGYGTLVTAGVPLDRSAPAFAQFPAAARAMLPVPDPDLTRRIKAVVALAPWGAQPGALAWRDQDLATLRTPLLLVDGDRDDVVDFERGVKRLFEATTGSDRYLLVYREAAHNIAGNPVPLPADADFQTIEFLTDPVWRKDRIEAINEHFISAFLDLHLKGDSAKRRYLDVPTPIAADGRWPSAFGQQWGGAVAGDGQAAYWRGFQRRWARGLELHHKAAQR
jgi:predicted dienelactone hydrolase